MGLGVIAATGGLIGFLIHRSDKKFDFLAEEIKGVKQELHNEAVNEQGRPLYAPSRRNRS